MSQNQTKVVRYYHHQRLCYISGPVLSPGHVCPPAQGVDKTPRWTQQKHLLSHNKLGQESKMIKWRPVMDIV